MSDFIIDPTPSDGSILLKNGSQTVASATSAGLLKKECRLIAEERVALNSNAGAAVAGDNNRSLNTVVANTITGASLNTSTGILTLPAGQYRIQARAPAYFVNRHILILRNTGNSADLLYGSMSYSAGSGSVQTDSFIDGVITLAATTTLRLVTKVDSARSPDGLGVSNLLASSVPYSTITVTQEVQ